MGNGIQMEKIKKQKENKKRKSLRKSFIFAVLYTVTIVVIFSGITIWGCVKFKNWLLPDSNQVGLNVKKIYDDGSEVDQYMMMDFGKGQEQTVLEKREEEKESIDQNKEDNKTEEEHTVIQENSDEIIFNIQLIAQEDEKEENRETQPNEKNVEYSVDKIENSYEALTPKKKMAYTGASVAMVGFPLIYSVVGILLCGFWFYKKKLDQPIKILADATDNIANQDLDFTVEYNGKDEMEALCDSFEKMRQALYENNKKLWDMLEERKMLQASVAHDLRNPIAIIEGYTEYLQMHLSTGKLSQDRIMSIADNLSASAKRLERYTNSIRDINNLEELEITPVQYNLQSVLTEIVDDFNIIAKKNHITLEVLNSVPECKVNVDTQVLCRIMENIFSNSLRYAKEKITIEFLLNNDKFIAKVWDDGPGFPEKILKTKNRYIFSIDKSGEHMGMGLVISSILCKKHGGELKLENRKPQGAAVTMIIKIK